MAEHTKYKVKLSLQRENVMQKYRIWEKIYQTLFYFDITLFKFNFDCLFRMRINSIHDNSNKSKPSWPEHDATRETFQNIEWPQFQSYK